MKENHVLKTYAGKAFVGTRAVFMGRDLHKDLRHYDWLALYMLSITGREFSTEQIKLLHAIWVCTNYPDIRIWNNRIVGLGASTKSTPALSISAGSGASEAIVYGGHPCLRAAAFLIEAQKKVELGQDVESIVKEELKQRRIYGYGRPINSTDERLTWIYSIANELKLDSGPHTKLSKEVESVLIGVHPALKMNYAAALAGLCADMGLSAKEVQMFVYPMFLAGMLPCYTESAELPANSLFKMDCQDISYQGVAKRSWKR